MFLKFITLIYRHITKIMYLCIMIRRSLYLFLFFLVCVLYTPQSVIYNDCEALSCAKSNTFLPSKARSNSKGVLSSQNDKKQDLILAFSTTRLFLNLPNDDRADFISTDNKGIFHFNVLNNYISRMRSIFCSKQSLAELSVLRI